MHQQYINHFSFELMLVILYLVRIHNLVLLHHSNESLISVWLAYFLYILNILYNSLVINVVPHSANSTVTALFRKNIVRTCFWCLLAALIWHFNVFKTLSLLFPFANALNVLISCSNSWFPDQDFKNSLSWSGKNYFKKP